ncbi:Zinc fingerC2H2 type family protein [Aphelenchoides avenae]|nr:Zinc fingerC2H2 type family protein [Aphelenchus avenae]
MSTADVITLSDDDDEVRKPSHGGSSSHAANKIGGTAAIVGEKPLDMQALFGVAAPMRPQTSNVGMRQTLNGGHSVSTQKRQNFAINPNTKQSSPSVKAVLAQLMRSSNLTNLNNPEAVAKIQALKNSYTPQAGEKLNNQQLTDKQMVDRVMAAISGKRTSTTPPQAPVAKKPYQPTVQNGHANHSVSAAGIQHKRVAAFTDHYLEFLDLNKAADQEEFSGHFKCTYNNCQKRIRNNVAFMCHLWAHVVRFKSHYEDDVTNMQLQNNVAHVQSPPALKDDVLRLRTCPECLLVQPNPYRMQLHYHRVHKREKVLSTPELSVCNVCESVVLTTSFTDHVRTKHKAVETPFWCRRCRYRTSTRYALLKHFSEKHCGSSMLVCPFCTVVFNVPANERNRMVVTAASYVQHVLNHDLENNQQCSACSTKFSEDIPAVMKEKLERHAKAHEEPISNKWKQRTKFFASVLEKKKSAVLEEGRGPKMCFECSEVIQDPKEHFDTLMKCDADGCHYETACKKSFDMHEKLSVCRAENMARQGRANLSSPRTSHVEVLKCTKDDFKTTHGGTMAQHSLKCGAEVIVSSVRSGSLKAGAQSEMLVAADEANLFGPQKPAKATSESPSEVVDETTMKLRELFPAIRIPQVLKMPVLIKAVSAKSDEADTKELQIRLARARHGIFRGFAED